MNGSASALLPVDLTDRLSAPATIQPTDITVTNPETAGTREMILTENENALTGGQPTIALSETTQETEPGQSA